MIIETGCITAIEKTAVWVETYQQSSCGKCTARSACGQSLLGKFGTRATQIRVLLNEHNPESYRIGQDIKIGIEETAFVSGVFYLYFVPLIFMLAGLFFSHAQHLGDGMSAMLALCALLFGALCSRLYTHLFQMDARTQPVIVNELELIS